ncbi:uncharacterized protein YbdZ (MbtH family) [Catenulispora sp. MAP12-49]
MPPRPRPRNCRAPPAPPALAARTIPAMTKECDMDENTRYQVLRNDEEQYSLWPLEIEVPAGWQPVGKEGTEAECSAYVDEVWTDMRPRSLRERMAETEA